MVLAMFALSSTIASAQVIDAHMHSYTEKDFWTGKARNGFESSKTTKEHLEQTVQKMNQHKIEYAVICGTIESIERYTKADRRFIPGYQDYEDTLIPVKAI